MVGSLWLISSYTTEDSNKNSWVLGQSSHIDKWNRTENPIVILQN